MRSRMDLLVLIVMLFSVFSLWKWGVSQDRGSETKLEKQSEVIFSQLSGVMSEHHGVMNALAGFYAGSDSVTKEELSLFLQTLFDGRTWGGIAKIEVWKDAVMVEEVFFSKTTEESVTFVSEFDILGKKFLIKTTTAKSYILQSLQESVLPGDDLKVFFNEEKVYGNENRVYRKKIENKRETSFGGVNIAFVLSDEDSLSESWNVFLGLGIVLSFVIYILVFSMTNNGRKAEVMAREIVGDLAKYKKAVDSLDSHLVITDENGVVVVANPAVSNLTGYSQVEVIGQKPSLWGKQMSRDFYTSMWDTIKNKKEVFKGEVVNKRKDGSLYTAYAVISPILNDDGKLIGFVGSETDITERKELENEQKRLNELMIGREIAMVNLKKKIANMEDK